MEHLGSLNPFTRRDEVDNSGDNVALQNALDEYADIEPEVHEQVIKDGVKLIKIGTTTQNSLHYIFNDPVKGLFGCLKNHVEKKTMSIPDPKNTFTVEEITNYWRLDPYGIYSYHRLQRVWWAKHIRTGITNYETLKKKHDSQEAKRKAKRGVQRIPKKFETNIDKYFKVDNSSAFSPQQQLCRRMQNQMYFTTLAYIPRMMDDDTKRVYQRYLDRWYSDHNCHGRRRIDPETRIPIYTVYAILHHICKPATVGEMYKDITLAERHRRHNCEQWWDDLDRRRNNLNLYLMKEQERNLANESITGRGRNSTMYDRNLIPSISALGLIKAESDRRESAVAREVVVAFVNQLSSEERDKFRIKTSELIARGQVNSDKAVDYYPLNSGVMNMPKEAALNPFTPCAKQNAQDVDTDQVLENSTLFDHLDPENRHTRSKYDKLKARLEVPRSLYRSNLFHYSWKYLGTLAREICLGMQASFEHDPRDTFKGSNRTYGPAAREKIDSLKVKIRSLKRKVKEIGKSARPVDKKARQPQKPKYIKTEHNAAKSAGYCAICLQFGLGVMSHQTCDPAVRKTNVNRRREKGTLFKPYAVNEAGTLFSQRKTDGGRNAKQKPQQKTGKHKCKYCDKAGVDTNHAARTTCLYQRLDELNVKKKEWSRYAAKFMELRKKYKKYPGKALDELLQPLERGATATVQVIKRKAGKAGGQPSKKSKINVSFRELPGSETSDSDEESGEPDTRRRH